MQNTKVRFNPNEQRKILPWESLVQHAWILNCCGLGQKYPHESLHEGWLQNSKRTYSFISIKRESWGY